MNQQQFFFDSNIFIALVDADDVHHARARSILEEIEQQDGEIFASDVVLNEVMSALSRRCAEKKRSHTFVSLVEKFTRQLEGYPILCLYQMLPQCYQDVVKLTKKTDGRLSFHDCMIVLFLKEVREVRLVTFDKDFEETSVKRWSGSAK